MAKKSIISTHQGDFQPVKWVFTHQEEFKRHILALSTSRKPSHIKGLRHFLKFKKKKIEKDNQFML